MLSRLGVVLLFLTLAGLGLAWATGLGYSIPIETAVKADLRAAASPALLDRKVLEALERDDVEEADMYLEIARFAGYELPQGTLARLNDAHSLSATVVRNSWAFGEGFVTGKGDTNAGIAGAVTSDLTVIGDLRDIAAEGAKFVAGEPYSEIVLGLSVIGVGLTAATVATGGGGVVAKAGVSLLKAARRSGRMTDEFAGTLSRMTSEAVNMPLLRETLRKTDLTDLARTQEAIVRYGSNVRAAPLMPLLTRLGDVNSTVGPAETIRMMRFIRTGENLDDVAGMTTRFGIRSRGIMELTGKIALRSFKTSFKMGEWIAASLGGILAWVAGLVAMAGLRGVRFRRRARA